MKKKEVFYVLACGSAWGLIEATLGAGLHLVHVPLVGTVLAAIGFAILLKALRLGLTPLSLAAVSLVAATWKLLDCAILGVPPVDPMVIRPAVAIASQGLAFAVLFGRSGAHHRAAPLALRLFAAVVAGTAMSRAALLLALGRPQERPTELLAVPLELALVTVGALALWAAIELVPAAVRSGRASHLASESRIEK